MAGAVISAGAGYADSKGQADDSEKASRPLHNAQNDLYSRAENIADTPYTPYGKNQVADLSANETAAETQAANAARNNPAGALYDKSAQLGDEIAGNGWSADTAAKYMNPYTQNVTDIALRKENQAYQSNVNDLNSKAATMGAFGGDRASLLQSATAGQHLLNQGDIEAQGQAQAYDNAIQTWQADNGRRTQAASVYNQTGGDITRMNADQISDLMRTGGADRAVSQMKLSTDYSNYLDQRGWDANRLNSLISAVGKNSPVGAKDPVNTASDLAGMGLSVAGLFGGGGSSAQPGQYNGYYDGAGANELYNPGSANIDTNLLGGSTSYGGASSAPPLE